MPDQVSQKQNSPDPNSGSGAVWNSADGMPEGQQSKDKISKLGPVVIAVVALILVGLAVFYYLNQNKTKQVEQVSPEPETLEEALKEATIVEVDPSIKPPGLPVAEPSSEKDEVEKFFQTVSPQNFKSEFIDRIPEPVIKSYFTYIEANNVEEKKSAARSMYLLVNNPAVNLQDPQFINFATDLKQYFEEDLQTSIY